MCTANIPACVVLVMAVIIQSALSVQNTISQLETGPGVFLPGSHSAATVPDYYGYDGQVADVSSFSAQGFSKATLILDVARQLDGLGTFGNVSISNSWSDTLTIDGGALNGQTGSLTYQLLLNADFKCDKTAALQTASADAFSHANGVENTQVLVMDALHLVTLKRQVITQTVNFTFGAPFPIDAGMHFQFKEGSSSIANGETAHFSGKTDLAWGGITQVLDSGSSVVTKFTTISASGMNYGHAILQPPHDFNGDGSSDLILQNTVTGARRIWFMNRAMHASTATLGVVPTTWRISGVGDFNGDGQPDLVWQEPATGALKIDLMDGVNVTSTKKLQTVDVEWQIAGVGDFNGDGKPDLAWQNSATGARRIWLMNGTSYSGSSASIGKISTDWRIACIGDFSGDGKPDIVLENSANGARRVWVMNGTTHTSSVNLAAAVGDWRIAGADDFNNDGWPDLVLQNKSTGARSIWFMNGVTKIGAKSLTNPGIDWQMSD